MALAGTVLECFPARDHGDDTAFFPGTPVKRKCSVKNECGNGLARARLRVSLGLCYPRKSLPLFQRSIDADVPTGPRLGLLRACRRSDLRPSERCTAFASAPRAAECLLRVTSCLRDCVSAMTGVPQIAGDLLQRPSSPSWARSRLSDCAGEEGTLSVHEGCLVEPGKQPVDAIIVVDMQVGLLKGPPKHDLQGVIRRINC